MDGGANCVQPAPQARFGVRRAVITPIVTAAETAGAQPATMQRHRRRYKRWCAYRYRHSVVAKGATARPLQGTARPAGTGRT